MDELIATTGLAPSRDVDFLVINCSLFCPTPSLCASVARKYKLKSTVRTYSLHGMGCSASLISEPRLGAHRSKPSFIFVPVRGPRRHRPGKAAPPEPRKLDCGWVTVRRNNVVRPGTLPLPPPSRSGHLPGRDQLRALHGQHALHAPAEHALPHGRCRWEGKGRALPGSKAAVAGLLVCLHAAVLLSNRAVDAFRAKYRLLHTVRVQVRTSTTVRLGRSLFGAGRCPAAAAACLRTRPRRPSAASSRRRTRRASRASS